MGLAGINFYDFAITCSINCIRTHTNHTLEMKETKHLPLVTRQDARNIVRTLDKTRKLHHENDAVSVECLVQELGEKVVIGYKPQGIVKEAFFQLAKESFLLVMTTFQAEMFSKHSSCIVCV